MSKINIKEEPAYEISPMTDQVIVKQFKPKTKTDSGIHVPPFWDNKHTRPDKGVVVKKHKDVKRVKEGDQVAFSKYAGRNLKYKEEEYVVLKKSEILGIIKGNQELVEIGETRDPKKIQENLENQGIPGFQK